MLHLLRVLLCGFVLMMGHSDVNAGSEPFQVQGEVRVEISMEYFDNKVTPAAPQDVSSTFSEELRQKLVAIYKFPGEFGVSDYSVSSSPIAGTASIFGRNDYNSSADAVLCPGGKETTRTFETWNTEDKPYSNIQYATLSYSKNEADPSDVDYLLHLDGRAEVETEITRFETRFDCGQDFSPAKTPPRPITKALDIGVPVLTLKIDVKSQPTTDTFVVEGNRELTREELEVGTWLPEEKRQKAALHGSVKWKFTFSNLPSPIFSVAPAIVKRGESVTLTPRKSKSVKTAQWLVEPDPSCYKASPVGFTEDFPQFENPKTGQDQTVPTIQTVLTASDPQLDFVPPQTWTMLCPLTVRLQYGIGGPFVRTSDPVQIGVERRNFGTKVSNKPLGQGPVATQGFSEATRTGVNIRPDCIKDGVVRNPLTGGIDGCGVEFDGYIKDDDIANLVQMAYLPWQQSVPLPKTDATGFLLSATSAPSAIEAGGTQGPFVGLVWIAGHSTKRTSFVALNPDYQRGGKYFQKNQFQSQLLDDYLSCLKIHEQLHGDYVAERLTRRTFSDTPNLSKDIVDPAWLIEGMWDSSEDALIERIKVPYRMANANIGSSNDADLKTVELEHNSHLWIYDKMSRTTAKPKCCSRKIKVALDTTSYWFDFISGTPEPELTSCK